MWAAVFVIALMGALNPVRLSAILLVVSRPRTLQNLLVFWAGAMIIALPAVVVPLLVLHDVAVVQSVVDKLSSSATVRHVQLGIGLCFLAMAAVVVIGIVRSRHQRTSEAALVGASKGALHAEAMSSGVGSAGGRAVQRLRLRAHDAWERGSLWISLAIGLISAPAPDAVLMVLAVILTSGAAIGIQLTAGVSYVVAMLVVVEAVLVSYVVTPAKTERALQKVHGWAAAHRRQVLAAVLTMVGLGLTIASTRTV